MMKRTIMKRTWITAVFFSLFCTVATAHPGHGLESAYAGLMHPLTGLDHLLVMVAIGLWAAKLGGLARWGLPLTFVLLMAVGAFFGANGLRVAGIETLIAASVMTMGFLLAMHLPVNKVVQFGLTAIFAFFHGLAHGLALQSHAVWSALIAMVVATSLLHALGYFIGVQRQTLFAKAQQIFAYGMLIVGAYLFAG